MKFKCSMTLFITSPLCYIRCIVDAMVQEHKLICCNTYILYVFICELIIHTLHLLLNSNNIHVFVSQSCINWGNGCETNKSRSFLPVGRKRRRVCRATITNVLLYKMLFLCYSILLHDSIWIKYYRIILWIYN